MNKLSVWTFSYRPRYYLTHPWKCFKDLYWNIRNFIHRGRYGYAYVDVWEWSDWWCRVGAEALRYMAKHGSGYPGYEPWETSEKWHEHLMKLADDLEWCADSQDILYPNEENEFKEAMDEITERCSRTEKGEDGMWRSWLDLTMKDKIVRNKYFAREKEIQEGYDKRRAEIFGEIGKNITRYWD